MGDTSISDYEGDDWMNVGMQFLDPSTINQNQTAIDQRHQAAKLGKGLTRPGFEIPTEATNALRSAEAQAKMRKLPGQAAIEGRLDETTATTIAMLERLGMGGPDMINGAARAISQQQGKENELGVAAANMHLRNQDILRDQQSQYANWQQQAWMWDKKIPYEQKAAAVAALKAASMQNTNEAFNTSVGGIKDFFTSYYSGGMGGSNSKNNKTSTGIPIDQTSGTGIDNTNISGGNQQTITRTPEQKSLWENMYN